MPDQSMRLCWENPFAKNVNASLEEVGSAIDKWIANSTAIETSLARIVDNSKHPHTRFQAFEVMGGGCTQTDCIGGACKRDVSKIMCGSAQELKAPCVVYSIGGNNQWQFELDVLRKTPCEVHTFDCTGERERFKVPEDPRLHFHFVCLGTENKNNTEVVGMGGEFWTLAKMTETLNHTKIDLLKTDIEGYEWPMFNSWPIGSEKSYESTVLPMQVLVEIHYKTHMPELAWHHRRDFKYLTDMIRLQERLLKMGYITVIRDDNRQCGHCSELTLLRVRCPAVLMN